MEQLFYLLPDKILPLHGLLPRLLLHRPRVGADLQAVLNHLPRDPGHVGWLPDKDVDISPEEGDEREFLFIPQTRTDASGLGGFHSDLNDLRGNGFRALWSHAGSGVAGVLAASFRLSLPLGAGP